MKTILFRFLASVLQFTFTISDCIPDDLTPMTNCLDTNRGATFSWYDGMSYDTADNVWADKACNANVTVSGINPTIFDGSDSTSELFLNNQPILVGTTDTAITFDDTSTLYVANEHTLFNLCRWHKEGGSPSQGRIIQSADINYFSGFWNAQVGVAAHSPAEISTFPSNLPDQWVLSTQTRDSYRGNGCDFTNPVLTPPTTAVGILSVNTGWAADVSDFACAEVIIFKDVSLELDERVCIEAYIKGKYDYGLGCPTEEPTVAPTEEPTEDPTVTTTESKAKPSHPKKSMLKMTHKNDGKKKRDGNKVAHQKDGKKKRSLLENDHEKTDIFVDSLGNEIAYTEENDE